MADDVQRIARLVTQMARTQKAISRTSQIARSSISVDAESADVAVTDAFSAGVEAAAEVVNLDGIVDETQVDVDDATDSLADQGELQGDDADLFDESMDDLDDHLTDAALALEESAERLDEAQERIEEALARSGGPTISLNAPTEGDVSSKGATWWQKDAAGKIIGQWEQTADPSGSVWESREVDSDLIANLDVGKLTAGDAEIDDLVAQRIAARTAQFIEVDVGKLVASDAVINEAVLNRLWVDSATANMFIGREFLGGTFTGATFRTASSEARVQLDSGGVGAYDALGQNVMQLAPSGLIVKANGGIQLEGSGSVRLTKAGYGTMRLGDLGNSVYPYGLQFNGPTGLTRFQLVMDDWTAAKRPALQFYDEQGHFTLTADELGISLWKDGFSTVSLLPNGGLSFSKTDGTSSWTSSRYTDAGAVLRDGATIRFFDNGRVDFYGASDRYGILERDQSDPAGMRLWGGNGTSSVWAYLTLAALSDGGVVRVQGIRNRTTTNPGNVRISDTNALYMSTSVKASKLDVTDAYSPNLLDVTYRSWFDKQEMIDSVLGRAAAPERRVVGAVAEEMAEVAPELCTYDSDGNLTGIAYERVALALIPFLRDLTNRVERLEGGPVTSWPVSPTYDDTALLDEITEYGQYEPEPQETSDVPTPPPVDEEAADE